MLRANWLIDLAVAHLKYFTVISAAASASLLASSMKASSTLLLPSAPSAIPQGVMPSCLPGLIPSLTPSCWYFLRAQKGAATMGGRVTATCNLHASTN